MIRTRICELLNIRYPILQGALFWISDATIVSSVSEKGALGVLSPYGGMEKDGDPVHNLERQIERTKMMTDKPFAVNIPLDLERAGELIDVILQKGVKIVITSAGDPRIFSEVFKRNGVTILHIVSNVEQAKKSEEAGVDAIIAQGFEAAARIGFDEIPLFSLIPQIVEDVRIPVVASGGIVDSRGVVAAFALGAEGVQMGTRFVAVKENMAHEVYKDAIIKSGCSDTAVILRNFSPRRVLKTPFTERIMNLESKGSKEEIIKSIGYRSTRDAQIEGNLEAGELYAGSSVGLIKEILSVKEIIDELIEGYGKIIKRLSLPC